MLSAPDGRDRLGQELRRCRSWPDRASDSTPQPIARDAGKNCALYQWFDGEPAVLSTARSGDHADQLADFLIELQRLCNAEGARDLRNASFALARGCCCAVSAAIEQVAASAGEHPVANSSIASWFERRGRPRRLDQRYASLGGGSRRPACACASGVEPVLLRTAQCAARSSMCNCASFIPVFRLGDAASDTVIHPGSDLPEFGANRVLQRLSVIFTAKDPSFAVRRDVLYPVFGYLVPDHPERLFAGKPFQIFLAAQGPSALSLGRPARQGPPASSNGF